MDYLFLQIFFLIQPTPRKKLYTEPLGSEHIQGVRRKASENAEDAVELQEDLREYLSLSPWGPTISRIEISETADCQFSLITTHKSELCKLFFKFVCNLTTYFMPVSFII